MSSAFELYSQPFYVANGLVVASWGLLRFILPGTEWVTHDGSGALFETREKEILMLVGFALLSKVRKSTSTHEFLCVGSAPSL